MLKWNFFEDPDPLFSIDKQLEEEILALGQKQIMTVSQPKYQVNPNFIEDQRGYLLGMSVSEIDKLRAFRAKGNYVNTIQEFQRVTQISDSLLITITPYLKFPEWKVPHTNPRKISKSRALLDINKASAEELKSVYGIGDVLSLRIIKFRNSLGGFLINEQLYDVYGLEPEVAARVLRKFKVVERPSVAKIDLNKATAYELSRLTYITAEVASQIVAYRKNNGGISSLNELTKIAGFPKDKIDRIKLYLTL